MKFILTLLLLVVLKLTHAQVNIGSNTFPKVYDQLVYRSYNMNAYINLGDSGANAFWDFSSFNLLANDSSVEDYLNVSGSFQPTHSAANFMVKRSQYGYTSYKFFSSTNNSSSIEWVGTQNAAPPSYHVYANKVQYLSFPFIYQQARIDAFKYRSQGFDFDSGTSQGTVKVTYPGWGRVKISNNQFYDSCLMELKVFNESNAKGEPKRYIEVNFYSSKFKGAIVRAIVSFYYNGSSFIASGQNVSLLLRPAKAPQPSSVSKILAYTISVYPNPFNQKLFIETNGNNFTEVQMLNSLGQTVVKQFLNNTDVHEIEIDGLPPAIYTILLKGINGNMVTRQIAKTN
jgi:hypothetical protein